MLVRCCGAPSWVYIFVWGEKPDTDKNGHMRSSSVADDVEFGVGKETGCTWKEKVMSESEERTSTKGSATCETNPAII